MTYGALQNEQNGKLTKESSGYLPKSCGSSARFDAETFWTGTVFSGCVKPLWCAIPTAAMRIITMNDNHLIAVVIICKT